MQPSRFTSSVLAPVIGLLCLLGAPLAAAGSKQALELRHQRLSLPGPPAAIVSTDLDRDGRVDLFVVLAYTEIEQVDFDRFEDMMQFSTVIPTLFDRREGRAFSSTKSIPNS